MDLVALIRNFGKSGAFFYNIVRGIDERPVEVNQERKSIGTEITFERDLTTGFEIIAELYKIERELMDRITDAGTTGRTITLKIKFADFRQITRSRTLPVFLRDFNALHKEVSEIRKTLDLGNTRIRLMGVSISNLETEDVDDRQLLLFDG
jgi:DNA polymerase-4